MKSNGLQTLRAIGKLMRPYQWTKNVLIFLPLFFNGTFLNLTALFDVFLAFVSFSCIASSIYCLNDINDLETDRKHPRKSKRPLANKEISKRTAIYTLIILLASGMAILVIRQFDYKIIVWASLYYGLNILYSFRLKQYAIIDTIIVSLGFVIRLFVGSIAGDVVLSQWIIIMTFLLALFLAFAKRRDDYIIYDRTGLKQRNYIVHYNLEFLNTVLGILVSVTIVAYIMYTVSPEISARFGNVKVYFSTIFVIAGLLRYMQMAIAGDKSDDPTEILFKDKFLLLCVIFWLLYFAIITYF